VGEGVGNDILCYTSAWVRYVEGQNWEDRLTPEVSRSAVPSFAKEAKLGQPRLMTVAARLGQPLIR
jgi:hypothetical protein